jgi:hypothetical protein
MNFLCFFQVNHAESELLASTRSTDVTNAGPTRTTRRLTWAHAGRPIPSPVHPTPRESFLKKCEYLPDLPLCPQPRMTARSMIFVTLVHSIPITGLYCERLFDRRQPSSHRTDSNLTKFLSHLQRCRSQTAQLCYPQVRSCPAHQEWKENHRIRPK